MLAANELAEAAAMKQQQGELVVVFLETVSVLSGLCQQRKFFRSTYLQHKSEPW